MKPRLLLVPSFTELEWAIRSELETWAEVATFDTPGVGEAPLPAALEAGPDRPAQMLGRWREAAAWRGLDEVTSRGWERFMLVADSHGHPTAMRIARARSDTIVGVALGHAALSHGTDGPRAPMRGGTWAVMSQLARQGSEAFVRYGIAQMTQGGVDEATAEKMVERFPDMSLVSAMVDALEREPEPIGDDLEALDVPLLLAKHEGCLGHTDEGFDDIVASFPNAQTAICAETCPASPSFAEALRTFADSLSGSFD